MKLTNFRTKGMDFSVRAGQGKTSTEAVIVLLIDNDNSWTNMKISYIISDRSDLFLGSFITDPYFLPKNNGNTYAFTYLIPNWVVQPALLYSIAQISGFKTNSNTIPFININKVSMNGRTGLVTVLVTIDSSLSLEYIYLSYILWINSGKLIVNVFNPSTIDMNDKTIYGIKQIQNNKFAYHGLSFRKHATPGTLPCIGARCPSSCVMINQCVSNNGIIANRSCFLCGNGVFYQHMSCKSFSCPENMILKNRRCVCKPHYQMIALNVCEKCPENSYWNVNKCQCNSGYYMKNTKCIACPSHSTYNQEANMCLCDDGYYWFNGGCITCGVNQEWDKQQKLCKCKDNYERRNS